jgi:hypothetical protein
MSAVVVLLVVLGVLVMLGVSLAAASVRVLREYERGVVFRFGRLVAQKGPGLVLLVPIADRMVRVTLRTITHTIPPQDVITRDNVPARRRRRRLLPRRGRRRIGRGHRELPAGDLRDREDHAALRARQGRARHAALGARASPTNRRSGAASSAAWMPARIAG